MQKLVGWLPPLANSFCGMYRCQLRDKEVDCREKDVEIQDLKEKVVKLTTVIRQMEMQKAELVQQVKTQVSDFEQNFLCMSNPKKILTASLLIYLREFTVFWYEAHASIWHFVWHLQKKDIYM